MQATWPMIASPYSKSLKAPSAKSDPLNATSKSLGCKSLGSKSLGTLSISSKLSGLGGNCSSLAVKKEKMKPVPPKAGIFDPVPRKSTGTIFQKFYDRGDIPIAVDFSSGAHRRITWKIDLEKIDYHIFLPVFIEGLRETQEPYKFLASKGTDELLEKVGSKIVPIVPRLIMPLKNALATKDPAILCVTFKKIQKLVECCPDVGVALVPYFRQLLPVFNIFKNKNFNIGDKIEYSQRKRENIGDLIQETLELLERNGGADAFINIKYMIPTYESCLC